VSRIEELVAELAPTGVTHRKLREVAGYSVTRVDANELDETNFVGVDNLLSNKGGKTHANYLPNTARLTAYEAGDVLLGNIRPYLKKVWLADGVGGCSGDVLAIRILEAHRDSLDSEFLYYLLSSDGFFAYNMQHAKGAKMPRGSKEAILNFLVPVPPPEVQREIVRILDQFTRLEAELEAELEARRLQYAFYRDSLLKFPEEGIRWVAIGEVCDVSRGRVMSKDYLRDHHGEFPVYSSQTQNNGIFGYIDTYAYDFESVTWTTDGANAGSVFFHRNEQFSITNVCGLLKVKESNVLSTKFVYYQLLKHAKSYVSEGMGNPKLMAKAMAAISIAIPPLLEQERIVTLLDKFDALVNDLSAGLPAELTARRQQYEYYRDHLLTFEEATA